MDHVGCAVILGRVRSGWSDSFDCFPNPEVEKRRSGAEKSVILLLFGFVFWRRSVVARLVRGLLLPFFLFLTCFFFVMSDKQLLVFGLFTNCAPNERTADSENWRNHIPKTRGKHAENTERRLSTVHEY